MLAASFDGELFLLASLSGCQAVSEFGGDHESCSRSGLISFSASDVTMAHLRITSPAYLRGFAPKTASDVIKWGATVTSPSPLRDWALFQASGSILLSFLHLPSESFGQTVQDGSGAAAGICNLRRLRLAAPGGSGERPSSRRPSPITFGRITCRLAQIAETAKYSIQCKNCCLAPFQKPSSQHLNLSNADCAVSPFAAAGGLFIRPTAASQG